MTNIKCDLLCEKCKRGIIIYTNKKGLDNLKKSVVMCKCRNKYELFYNGGLIK